MSMESINSTNKQRNASRKRVRAPKRFTPLFNDAFLQIFGRADSEPVTKPLINAVLRKAGIPEVERIEWIAADPSLPGGIDCKTPRLDVVVCCDDGRLIDLEAQRRKTDVGQRSLFYGAKLLVEHTPKSGDEGYFDLTQAVVVMLLEGNKLFPNHESFVSVSRMKWSVGDAEEDGPDNIVLVLVELDKIRERYNKESIHEVLADESLAWLYLLAAGYESPEEVETIMESFPTMEEFAKRYGIAIDDPDLKRAYDKYWEADMEYKTMVAYAKREARAEGRAAGLAEGLAEGRAEGLAEGRAEGLAEGRAEGLTEGRAEGHAAGLAEGKAEGRQEGITEALRQSIEALRAAGMDDAADLLEGSA